MSLLHRSSSTESFRRASLPPPSGSPGERHTVSPAPDSSLLSDPTQRRLSYNPLTDTKSHGPLLPPAQVSLAKRIGQVSIAVVYCLLAAGIIFGYAAIKPVFIAEGVYRHLCTPEEVDQDVDVCFKQELRLNFMFTIAAVSTNVAALPIGIVLDRFGPHITSCVGCGLLALGSLLLAFAGAAASRGADLYIPGYLLLGLGGPFVFISSFQLSNAFPKSSGLVLAFLTGAFDTSSALFLGYRLLYQGTDGQITPQVFFLAYLVVPLCIFVAQLTVMPGSSYQAFGEGESSMHGDAEAHTTTALGDEGAPLLPSDSHKKPKSKTDIAGVLHHLPASAQLRSPWFILITLFTIIQMTRINFFVATIRPQYTFLLGAPAAHKLNAFFDVALPLGGIVSVPLIGAVLDNLPVATVLMLLTFFATVIGALNLFSSFATATATILLFVLFRPFYYTAVSDYSAKVFGFETFGQVYGLVICLAGLGNLSQSALDGIVWGYAGGDYRGVNGGLLVAGLGVGTFLSGFVWWQGKKRASRWERGE